MKGKETSMRRIALVAVLLSGFFLITGQPAKADHISATYEVDGTQGDGTFFFTFTGCLHFNDPDPGDLRIVSFGPGVPAATFNLTWRHQDLDTKLHRFQAVRNYIDIPAGSTGTFMIFGGFKGVLVGGQGVNDSGHTFEFLGRENAKCAPPE